MTDRPMQQVRGTLILADQVYQTRDGKWIVAGTYSRWHTPKDELAIHRLFFYVRLQFETAGGHRCRLQIVDRSAVNVPALFARDFTLDVGPADLPVYEACWTLDDLRIRSPVPTPQRQPGMAYALQTLIWLTVDGHDLATCPLDFLFLGPPSGASHALADPDPRGAQ